MNRLILTMLALVLLAPPIIAAQDVDLNVPRVLPIHNSVWLQELTWLEVRDLLAEGKRTVLIPAGGIEQNGPYLSLDKHQIVLRATMDVIARKMGDALVAPSIQFAPEGNFEPKTSHMRYPGTISMTQETFRAILTDVATSMKLHGFENIVFLGDSGGDQAGMAAVAETLSKAWAGSGTQIIHVPEYYDNERVSQWLEQQGIHEVSEGFHDDLHYTATMMLIDPVSVRADVRRGADLFRINGVELESVAKTQELGRRMVEYQASYTIEAIRRRLGGGSATNASR